METNDTEDKAEEEEQIQQGIGKRVIGEPENFLVRSGIFSLLYIESIEKMITRVKSSSFVLFFRVIHARRICKGRFTSCPDPNRV